MSDPVKSRRPYRSPVREERARANREAILHAARQRFVADGYPRTSVASIAADAGVSEDLVYVLFTNKRQLLVEVLNYSVTGELDSPRVLEQHGPRAVREEKDQRRQIAMFAADITRRTNSARPIDDVIRSAALVDESVAEKHREMHATRFDNLTQFVTWVAANGPLREGISVDEAAATVWALTGPDVHRLLVDDLGWDLDRYTTWVRRTLEDTLLSPADTQL
ncbi:MAG TPA: helix-turn-helix domain-containing protein [Humibacillus sp.]|nr:helix-turn-helix domain-containing protein [Humibacillus sp.]